MCFASQNNLNRSLRVIQQGPKSVKIGEEQAGPLVGCEAPSKAQAPSLAADPWFGSKNLCVAPIPEP